MSEILSRAVFETCLADQTEVPWEEEVRMILAHDAALRLSLETATAEQDRLAALEQAWRKRVDVAERERDDEAEAARTNLSRLHAAERERDEALANLSASREVYKMQVDACLGGTCNGARHPAPPAPATQ